MKKLLVAAFLSVVSMASFATDMSLPIRDVVDGDTIRTAVKLPCPLCTVSVRIRGIDTPESTYLAKCPIEKAKALEAKAYLIKLVGSNTTMTAKDVKWDKYGGRIDAVVVVGGVDVGQAMIEKGFAKPYSGVGKKPDWCN